MSVEKQEALDQLKHIRSIMEQSSRFISLSGWSGFSAGVCGLLGAWLAHQRIASYYQHEYLSGIDAPKHLFNDLLLIACFVFFAAAVSAIFFSFRKSKKQGVPIWGELSRRLLWHTLVPMVVGGIFILKLIQQNQYEYVSSACLIFYGLGVLNGSKYTIGNVKYLGYTELVLGLLCLFFTQHGLLFWGLGFGVSHIVYGLMMWYQYDRK